MSKKKKRKHKKKNLKKKRNPRDAPYWHKQLTALLRYSLLGIKEYR